MPERVESFDWAWSLFWQADNLQACVPAGADSGVLEQHWQDFFTALPQPAEILDVGTGNGALALLAHRSHSGASTVHAIDTAEIDPARFVVDASGDLAAIRFHAGVAMESMPFGNAVFDAVVGQYSLEYSNTALSVPALMRVLRPGGRFQFLLHSAGAVLETRNSRLRRQAQTLLDSSLFTDLQRLLPAIFTAQSCEHEASTFAAAALEAAKDEITRFSNTLAGIEDNFRGAADRALVDNLLLAVRQVPAQRTRYNLRALQQRAAGIEAMLRAQVLRFQAMEEAALDQSQRDELRRQFEEAAGTGLSYEEARVNGKLLGHWLQGRLRN